MHAAAHNWVARHADADAASIVDVGGRDINGTVRGLFPGATSYVCVDLVDGPAVDVVADFCDWAPTEPVDVVVCCEVAEHTPEWRTIIEHAGDILAPGGTLIFTAAGPERAPHSAVDGAELRDGEHYENVDPNDLLMVFGIAWDDFQVEHNAPAGDVYARARKAAAVPKKRAPRKKAGA